MKDFFVEGGFGIYPVLVFGLAALALAFRYVRSPREGDVALLAGVGLATLLLGVLGTVVGVQVSAGGIHANPDAWLFLVGLKESLNVLVTALVAVTLEVLVATYGAVRLARRAVA